MMDSTGAALLRRFREEFHVDGVLYRAPGRINLIGEHTDYHDGLVMPLNTALYTWVVMRPRSDREVYAHARLFGESAHFSLDGLAPAGDGGWVDYVKAVLWAAEAAGHALTGGDLLIDGNIPLGGGLSSSASLESAIAKAFLCSAGYELDPADIALLCQQAENQFVGMQCGIMDQFVVTACPRDHAILLDCRSLDFEPVALPDDLELLVINSGVRHQHSGGGYNQRREESEAALLKLKESKPAATALRDFTAKEVQAERSRLDDVMFRRALHVCTENQRVLEMRDALMANDLRAMGEILNASHDSMANDYEISCEAVDHLVGLAQTSPVVYGARMVGGGFGGCTINLVEEGCIDQAIEQVCGGYERFLGEAPWYHVVQATDPAGEVRA